MPGSTRIAPRPWGGKPKQNTRSPQGGGQDPKQCPGDAQSVGLEINEPMAHQEIACPKSGSGNVLVYAIDIRGMRLDNTFVAQMIFAFCGFAHDPS